MESERLKKADYWKVFCNYCTLETWKRIAFVLELVNVPLLLYIFALSIAWYTQRENFVRNSHLSFTCSPIKEGSAECQGSIVDDGDSKLCCNESLPLSKRFDLLAKMSYTRLPLSLTTDQIEHCIPSPREYDKPAARVEGIIDEYRSILLWNHTNKEAFFHDVKYVSGRFIITKNGYYFIYSQVTFHEDHSQSDDVTLSHSVYRQGPITKEKLLESVRAQCQLQTKSSNSSKFVGAVFYMREGEELMVEVSDFTRVSNTPHANFFGLHLI